MKTQTTPAPSKNRFNHSPKTLSRLLAPTSYCTPGSPQDASRTQVTRVGCSFASAVLARPCVCPMTSPRVLNVWSWDSPKRVSCLSIRSFSRPIWLKQKEEQVRFGPWTTTINKEKINIADDI